jgi:23S rRNA pseudouridine1911/1915/1917 synthase
MVEPQEAGARLDRHVAARLEQPRNQVQRWIEEGHVTLNSRPAKVSAPVAAGDAVSCSPPPPRDDRIVPEEGDLALLYSDSEVVVLDKPAGLVVHPGAGRPTGTLAHRLLDRFPEMAGVGGPGRPGIVHRLDQGTSGVLVVARTAEAYAHLAQLFADRRTRKVYLAVVYGRPKPAEGWIDAPIGRHPQKRTEMAVRPRGRAARTGYSTLGSAHGISVLVIALETGRTHQIRVHLRHLGHPLVGDPVYGEARWKGLPRAVQAPLRDFPRPALHAWRLAFPHPTTAEPLAFEAPVPADLRALWAEVAGTEWPVRAARGGPPSKP